MVLGEALLYKQDIALTLLEVGAFFHLDIVDRRAGTGGQGYHPRQYPLCLITGDSERYVGIYPASNCFDSWYRLQLLYCLIRSLHNLDGEISEAKCFVGVIIRAFQILIAHGGGIEKSYTQQNYHGHREEQKLGTTKVSKEFKLKLVHGSTI